MSRASSSAGPSSRPPTGGGSGHSALASALNLAGSSPKRSSRAVPIRNSSDGVETPAMAIPSPRGTGHLSQSVSADSLSSSLPSHARIGLGSSVPREPLRIASASPLHNGFSGDPSQSHGHASSLGRSFPIRPPVPSPPFGASLAPATERTRLLLDSGVVRSNVLDAMDLEDEEVGRGEMSFGPMMKNGSYNSLSNGSSACGSPSDSSSPNGAAKSVQTSRAFIAFILPVTVILCVGNSVTWKRTLNRFASVDGSHKNLEFFVNQWTLVLFTLIAGTVLAYRWFFTELITPEMRAFPKRRFAVMGGLDAVAGLFAVVGSALTAGQVQIVVQQANIPITMLLSRVYLKVSSYAWSQYAGASIIVLGGLLSAFGAGGHSGVSAHVAWFGPVLILIGIVPGSMSNVYKEESFKSCNLDIYFVTTYVALWQTLLSFACIPLFTLSYFGGIAIHEMPQNLYDGWRCFLGDEIPGFYCEDPFPSTSTLLLLYVLINFAFNMALLSMVKHGSALFLVVAVAVALPITNLVFTQHWAMGGDVETLSKWNMVGIIMVVGGFLLYSLMPDGSATAAQRGEGEGAGDVSDFEHISRSFLVPTGASGHSLYVTEYLPALSRGKTMRERRHSFDFHSSPSVRDAQAARKKRLEKKMSNRGTPSRTP